jgi:fatty acid amide hydrolase
MSADGGVTARGLIAHSPVEPVLAPLLRTAALPNAARLLLAQGLDALGEGRTAFVLRQLGEKSVAELWRLTKAARDYRLTLLAAMAAAKVDLVLCPAHATPAVPHTKSAEFLLAGSYSMLWNLVQFPAGVVPVTSVLKSETARERLTRDRIETTAILVDRASEGLPVGVQIVGRPFQDEAVLECMVALEQELQGTIPVTPRMPA